MKQEVGLGIAKWKHQGNLPMSWLWHGVGPSTYVWYVELNMWSSASKLHTILAKKGIISCFYR